MLIIPAPGDTSGPGPAPVPTGGSKEIRVDISEQRMYVYQDGALLWNWVASTGEPGRDTRPGNYSVLNKIPNAYGSTWDLWMPNWLSITWTTLCFEAECLANEPYTRTGNASVRLGNRMPLSV